MEQGESRGWRRIGAALGAVAALVVGAAAAGDPGAQIEIRNFQFVPATVAVRAGSTVTWVNHDDEIHAVLSEGLFASPGLEGEQRFAFRFEKPGTYEFRCALHPQMKGTVVVR